MNIPQHINIVEIIKSPEKAMLWLALQTTNFIDDPDSKNIQLDTDVDKYINALSYALTSSLGVFMDGNKVTDQRGMIDMLLDGLNALIGAGYFMGYQKAKSETKS